MAAKSLRAILQGSPINALHQVDNAELRVKLEEMEVQAALSGAIYFEDAVADLPTGEEGDTGFVLDAGAAGGVYLKGASTWAKTSELPASFLGAVLPEDLSDVAFSGAYGDLSGKPTLGTAAAEDATVFASAAQGELADSALQPADVGTAAAQDVGAFATAVQGELADSALQDASAFATAGQGTKADSAVQPSALPLEGALALGDYPELVASTITGSPQSIDPIVAGGVYDTGYSGVVTTAYGRAVRMTNLDNRYAAPIAPTKILPGRVYALRAVAARVVNPADANTDPVTMGVVWLNSIFAAVNNVVGKSLPLVSGGGATRFAEITYSRDVAGADFPIPSDTLYGRPWVRSEGTAQTTDVVSVGLVDVTEQFLAATSGVVSSIRPMARVSTPGDTPHLFLPGITGAPNSATPLIQGDTYEAGYSQVSVDGYGRAIRMTNLDSRFLAPAAATHILSGRVYRLKASFARATNPADPETSVVEIGVVGLSRLFGTVQSVEMAEFALTAAQGVVSASGLTVSLDVPGVSRTLAAGSVYARPWVRTKGTDHATDVIELELEDITEAWNVAQSIATDSATGTSTKGANLGRFAGKVGAGRDMIAQGSAVTVMTMGDSIAFSTGVSQIFNGVDSATVVYAGATAGDLGVDMAGWEPTYSDVDFTGLNVAQAGTDTREQSLRFLADYPHRSPDLIFIHDWVNGRTTLTDAEYEYELRRSLQMIRQTTDADIILSLPVPYLVVQPNATAYYAEERFSIVRRLAAEFGCEMIDWWKEFAEWQSLHPGYSLENDVFKLNTTDKIHPSALGYAIMRRVVHDRLINPDTADYINPQAIHLQGEPLEVVRFGEIAALGQRSAVTIPATWTAVEDDTASGGFRLETSGIGALSIPFEGNRLALRVLGQVGGGTLSFAINGSPVSDLHLHRVTTPSPNDNNHVQQNLPTGGGADRHRPWRIETSGTPVAENFTLTFTSNYLYTVTGSESGALVGTGSINTDSTFDTPAGGKITIRSAYWTRKLTSENAPAVPEDPYRSGDIFTWAIKAIGIDNVDTAALDAGWNTVEIAHRLPAGQHTLTITGDGDDVAIDLLKISKG